MKTLNLTEEEFQLLGKLIGTCFCGDEPLLQQIYDKLYEMNGDTTFGPPSINEERSTKNCLYLTRSVGVVLSYNVPIQAKQALQDDLEGILKLHGATLISI